MYSLSDIVIARLAQEFPQQIHIPWPKEVLGEYGRNDITDAEMDLWVLNNVSIPEPMVVAGICAGKAYYGRDLRPCIVVTVVSRKRLAESGIVAAKLCLRKIWADDRGGVL